MCDGQDFDVIASHPINQAEGIEGEDVAASAAAVARPHVRILGDGADRMPKLFAKAVRCDGVAGGVPVICRLRLLCGSGVEPDGRQGHSAPL